MNNNFSNKDKKDWENFVTSKQKLYDKDLKKEEIRKELRSVDLHGYTLDEANKFIEKFIVKAFNENIKKLIVVTGKGLHSNKESDPYVSRDFSILKYSVPEYIYKNKNLMDIILDIKEAKIEDGGSGAFYVYLKKNKN